jgi:UDPglucose--hexose-1-phosphate uridylyltransferase
MPEFRQNKATKEWVIVAGERAKRPSDFAEKEPRKGPSIEHDDDCPFCMGNEHMTPEPVMVYPEQGDWQVRVVPNKFAALQPDLATTRSRVGDFLTAKGFGIAEVVIESPQHNKTLATMSMREVAQVLKAYRARQIEISNNENINLVTIFRNHGARAGTSLEHPHSQIIATPIVPPHVRYPIEQAVAHYDKYGSCVYCDMLREELYQKERIIHEVDNFAAFCPFAARTPFETRIYPKRHQASYMMISDEEIEELAWLLRNVLAKIHKCLDNPDYNYVLRSSPIGDENTRHLHWYMLIIPKVSTAAGFEIGTGIYINVLPPETSAKHLRDTKVES